MAPPDPLIAEWTDIKDTDYNQILLCISPELQTTINETYQAKDAWSILVRKYESADPSKISIIRTQYKNHCMVEGESVVTYMMTMKEYKRQLDKMGETIADSTHATTLLRNLPESWQLIAQTVRMIM
jgi:gag-polypeptide of LTR copia-type